MDDDFFLALTSFKYLFDIIFPFVILSLIDLIFIYLFIFLSFGPDFMELHIGVVRKKILVLRPMRLMMHAITGEKICL